MNRRLVLVLLPLLLTAPLLAADPPHRILFVGNSYTGQVKAMLTRFVKASPHSDAVLEFLTPGGKQLVFHAQQEKTVARIREGDWDIVVLQDQSQTPAVFPKTFLEGSKSLHEIIEKAGARTAYYATWGRRDGDKRNAHLFPDYASMQKALTSSYEQAARRDKALLVPVGEAWGAIRKAHPELGKQLYKGDGSHPSAKGAYLASACFYATLFRADPSKVEFLGGLSDEEARLLRAAAIKAYAAAR